MVIESSIIRLIKEKFANYIIGTHSFRGDDTIIIHKEGLKAVMQFLKEDKRMQFNMLIDITAVDYLNEESRFEVVYHLLSLPLMQRIRIKVPIPEKNPQVDTVTNIWPAANWFEREVWDMFGIKFNGHPNLRRLLMYDEFEGHPLRKDYPLKKQQPRIPLREVKTKY